jgi:hypothetical protein
MDEQTATALDTLVAKLREGSRDRMLDHTIPIHVVHGEGNPIVNGSGVLLQIADVPFLLSCAHVLKVASEKNARLLIPSTDHAPLVVLTGVDFRWTEDERIDLAFAVLPANIAASMPPGKKFLRLSDLELDRKARAGVYSVAGYPQETTDRDLVRANINSSPVSFTSFLFDGRVDDHVDGVTIALTFEMNAVGDVTGERARPPSFKGISGCGIWRLAAMDGPAPAKWTPEHVKLVGIEHGVLPEAIKGSLVAELIGLIKREFPALAPCIELHGG